MSYEGVGRSLWPWPGKSMANVSASSGRYGRMHSQSDAANPLPCRNRKAGPVPAHSCTTISPQGRQSVVMDYSRMALSSGPVSQHPLPFQPQGGFVVVAAHLHEDKARSGRRPSDELFDDIIRHPGQAVDR